MNFKFEPFESCGLVRSKISHDLLLEIKDMCLKVFNNKSLQKPYNNSLAGNIEHEYIALYNKKFNKFILEMAEFYNKQFDSNNLEFNVRDVWINFQKKYEFNPIHAHEGDLSFVLWVQIPYDLDKEKNNPSSVNSNYNCASDFFYLEPYQNKNISLSKDNEGDIIMFDSNLYHGVYPFYTSDDYRISVSGNLNINDKKQPKNLNYA